MTSLNQRLGWLMGHPRGVTNHFEGAVEILGARLAGGRRLRRVDTPAVRSLRARGYADLGEFYDPALIERVRTAYRAAVDDPALSRERRTPWARQLRNAVAVVPGVAALLDARMRAHVEGYYGGPFRVYKVQLRSNFHAPDEVTKLEEVYNNYWHVDDRPTSTLKLFVNLSEVSEHDGPLELVDFPETRRLVRQGHLRQRSAELAPELLERSEALVRFVGRPGRALLATTARVLHHARLVAPGGRRDLATFAFRPSRRPLPDDWAARLARGGSGGGRA